MNRSEVIGLTIIEMLFKCTVTFFAIITGGAVIASLAIMLLFWKREQIGDE